MRWKEDMQMNGSSEVQYEHRVTFRGMDSNGLQEQKPGDSTRRTLTAQISPAPNMKETHDDSRPVKQFKRGETYLKENEKQALTILHKKKHSESLRSSTLSIVRNSK
jgi:hypothetical protein